MIVQMLRCLLFLGLDGEVRILSRSSKDSKSTAKQRSINAYFQDHHEQPRKDPSAKTKLRLCMSLAVKGCVKSYKIVDTIMSATSIRSYSIHPYSNLILRLFRKSCRMVRVT